MRILLVSILISVTAVCFSQERKFSNLELSYQIALGLNMENSRNTAELPYGVHFSENSLKAGHFIHFEVGILFKKKLGMTLGVTSRNQTRNNTAFIGNIEGLYPNKLVYINRRKFNTNRIIGGFSIYRKFQLKQFLISPRIGIGFSIQTNNSYSYIVREPSTNFFSRYRMNEIGESENPISFGMHFAHSKLEWLELVTNFNFSANKMTYNYYAMEIGDHVLTPPTDVIYTEHNRFYWSIGLNFMLQITRIRDREDLIDN